LYKGKVWVDTTDHAVSQMVAKPAKNPSFWISLTEIEQEYKKIGEFGCQSGTSASRRSGLGAQQN